MSDSLIVATAPLDETCKTILSRLKEGGWNMAGESYVVDVSQVPIHEFDYLLKHGGIVTEPFRVVGVLSSYATAKHGPDVGKVAFKLNFDLK